MHIWKQIKWNCHIIWKTAIKLGISITKRSFQQEEWATLSNSWKNEMLSWNIYRAHMSSSGLLSLVKECNATKIAIYTISKQHILWCTIVYCLKDMQRQCWKKEFGSNLLISNWTSGFFMRTSLSQHYSGKELCDTGLALGTVAVVFPDSVQSVSSHSRLLNLLK